MRTPSLPRIVAGLCAGVLVLSPSAGNHGATGTDTTPAVS